MKAIKPKQRYLMPRIEDLTIEVQRVTRDRIYYAHVRQEELYHPDFNLLPREIFKGMIEAGDYVLVDSTETGK